MLNNFEYYMPVRFVFGEGAIHKTKEFCHIFNIKKPCVVTDSFLATTEFGKKLIESFSNAFIYTNVEENPGIMSVDQFGERLRMIGCDGIIALGGGSCMDTAKAGSVVAFSGESIRNYLDGTPNKKEITDSLPVIAIPTTSGTGSEVSQYAVITDEKTLRKDSITSDRIYPKAALVDPCLTVNLPKNLTVSTGLDVLSHALESMFSKIQNSFTEILALEAIKKVFEWLPICVNEPERLDARKEMAFASTLAGIAMSHCCGTLPHGMGCPLSGHFHVPHGLAVGVLQKYGILTMEHIRDKECCRILRYLNPEEFYVEKEAKDRLVEKIDTLFDEIGCEKKLSRFQLTEEGIEKMTNDAMIHGCTGLNPVEVTKDEIREIYFKVKE